MRPVILGEAPSRTGDAYHDRPLSGQAGKRLAVWSGVVRSEDVGDDYATYYDPLRQRFELMNLLQRYPGPQGTGAALPRADAAAAWEVLKPTLVGRVVVVLGARVAATAGFGSADWHQWVDVDGISMAAIPHPSGLTRIYNDEASRARAGETLRQAMRMAS